jgi:NAD(P)H-hydrate epimerase
MARLLGKDIKDVQNRRKETAAEFAKEFNKVVALKGHNTVVTAPTGEVYINDTGNAGMASAGVGDVLAGMIGSFIGQKVDPYPAAVLGVYFHGLAGDMAAREKGLLSLLASDILSKLPEALKRLV